MRRAYSVLTLFVLLIALEGPAEAARERTLRARILEIDHSRERFRADVAGRPAAYRVADAAILRGFRKGDLVFLRVRGSTVVDVRLAVVTGEVIQADDRTGLVRIGGRNVRFDLARPALRKRLRRGEFVRLEVDERRDGARVITRVY